MDDLEFYRRVYSNPQDCSRGLQETANSNESKRAFLKEMKEFDQKLEAALEVDVPEGLSNRLLLKQSLELNSRRLFRRGRMQLATAASIAFIIGLSVSQLDWRQAISPSIGSVALAHVYTEAPFTQGIDEQVSLSTMNAKMTRYGIKMKGEPSQVYFVNHCNYHGSLALHMIIKGKRGRVAVFIVPDNIRLRDDQQFGDDKLNGEVFKLQNAKMVIVGEKQEPIGEIADNLKSLLQEVI